MGSGGQEEAGAIASEEVDESESFQYFFFFSIIVCCPPFQVEELPQPDSVMACSEASNKYDRCLKPRPNPTQIA